MKNKTAKEFIIIQGIIGIGISMMILDIHWLGMLGILLLGIAGILDQEEERAHRAILPFSGLMLLFIISSLRVYFSKKGLKQSDSDCDYFVFTYVILWGGFFIWDYWKWRAGQDSTKLNPEKTPNQAEERDTAK